MDIAVQLPGIFSLIDHYDMSLSWLSPLCPQQCLPLLPDANSQASALCSPLTPLERAQFPGPDLGNSHIPAHSATLALSGAQAKCLQLLTRRFT